MYTLFDNVAVRSLLVIVSCACLTLSGVVRAEESKPRFDFNGYKYPLLYEGESIGYFEHIAGISSFEPLFGKDRTVVNPVAPEIVNGANIRFSAPGEYYIRVNDNAPLKVLVLSRDEPFSSAVTRLFDFVSANLLFANVPEESKACDINKDLYIKTWFNSDRPGRLLCGPTHGFFRTIISDRLQLPTRIVTFPGVYRWGGRIYRSSHNITEVYLPDKKKWVLLDINYGFFVKWMDALELAQFFHRNSSGDSGMTVVEKMLALKVHTGGPTLYWSSNNLAETDGDYSETEVSAIPTSYLWRDAFRFYFSGAAYWGGELQWVKPTGTEFLPGQYLFANLHSDPELKKAAVDWIESFGIKPTVVSPEALREMLDSGHADLIASKPWESGRPVK